MGFVRTALRTILFGRPNGVRAQWGESEGHDDVRGVDLSELGAAHLIEYVDGDRSILLCEVEGKPVAIPNSCPHAGSPLNDSRLVDGILTCPFHGWSWDLRTGECQQGYGDDLKLIDLRVMGLRVIPAG